MPVSRPNPQRVHDALAAEAVGPSGHVTDLTLLENRFPFARWLRDVPAPTPVP